MVCGALLLGESRCRLKVAALAWWMEPAVGCIFVGAGAVPARTGRLTWTAAEVCLGSPALG